MYKFTEGEIKFLETALATVETPFTFGDMVKLMAEDGSYVGILAGLDALAEIGFLQKIDGPVSMYSRTKELNPSLLRRSLEYVQAVSESGKQP